MPNTASAKKALRQSWRRRGRNLKRKRTAKETLKQIERLTASGKQQEASALLPAVYKALDKAAKRHLIEKNTASRKKSRIARLLNAARSAAV